MNERPIFPKRAVVTSGMPYGNKKLHFGHIAGCIVPADFFARFLRDRIGEDNVIFVSGTDCYGSPAMESFRKLKENGYKGSIQDFVIENHNSHIDTIKNFEVDYNFFGASAVGEAKENHIKMSEYFIKKMDEAGQVSASKSLQFFDEKLGVFLNGRQVIGKCPIEGCTSEKGYADECDMGHQYDPTELINPVSALSGEKPIFKEISNLYFNLENYTDILKKWIEIFENDETYRPFVVKEIKEFLKKPQIYIKKDYADKLESIKKQMPKFTYKEDEGNKASLTIEFEKLSNREIACEVLRKNEIRFRTGKTLVPFRLSGNVDWGVPVPEMKGVKDATFYVWPESLWAPITFTKTYLEKCGKNDTWQNWWCNPNCKVYQFLGEDNIYFYGPAEMAIFLSTQGENPTLKMPEGQLQIPRLVVNKHILFLNKKASSSGSIKPPMADELLNYYTAEQLRAHFLGLGLGINNVSFMPKPFNPTAQINEADPALREGNLLTNVFNRVARTIFYTIWEKYNGFVPNIRPDNETLEQTKQVVLEYERLMASQKFHVVMNVLDSFIRNINKYYVANIKLADGNAEQTAQVVVNTLHMLKVATTLVHPIAPKSCETLAEYLNADKRIFSWDYIFDTIESVTDVKPYKLKEIPPKFDFFAKHPSQLVF